ncbi:MAG TPA: NAD(P)(+) transhydrogenase (Re/Si-specific) subunit beta [Candidatus Limnocylindrales bacterium]
MSAEWAYTLVYAAWLVGAAGFVLGLHRMNSPATARAGNRLSAGGMTVAVGATLLDLLYNGIGGTALVIIVVGFVVGGGLGLYMARTVAMTAMPQLVSLFNAVGGGAAALVAIDDYIRVAGTSEDVFSTAIFVVLGAAIGCVTFTGSLIASGKLQGLIPGKPIIPPGGRAVTYLLAAVAVIGLALLVLAAESGPIALDSAPKIVVLFVIVAAALVFGVTLALPIGGADMPVVISLLNSFTGTAAAMAGFVIDNPILIIAGALVGASGGILTKLMADAMNRSVVNIMVGGFGTGDAAAGAAVGGGGGGVREVSADDVAIQLAYAQHVIVVPGYGLAVAQAQHAVRELAELLEDRGVDVSYAIHPVAGRMPGHMNVLLAEANVPYPQLKEMDDINPEFDRCDVALVVGANDVTNPAARSNPASPIYGMPILDVDHARSIVVIKRSMRPGYAGIDNELYTNSKTGMLFADAKEGLGALIAAVKQV